MLDTLVYTSPEGGALKSLIMKLKTLNADTLYVPDAAPLLHGLSSHLKMIGLESLKIFSVYSAQSEDVIRALGDAGEGMIISYPKIEGDALEEFPNLAASIVMEALNECSDPTAECIMQSVRKRHTFDQFGVLRGEIGHKVLRRGRFEWMD